MRHEQLRQRRVVFQALREDSHRPVGQLVVRQVDLLQGLVRLDLLR